MAEKRFTLSYRGAGVALCLDTEPWWITHSKPGGKLGECRTYLLLGLSLNRYTGFAVLNLHLVLAKLSIFWLRTRTGEDE